MRILVTGKDGQIAVALSRVAGDDLEIVCAGRPELDVTDGQSVRAAIERHRPDVLVNPAAYTAVDNAESEPDMAFAVNRDGAGNAAAAAADAGLPIVHMSTDYVFSGDKLSPYVETDETGPRSVYGASKLAGEAAVARANEKHVILRTSWVYAPWGNNFARTMLRLAGDRDVVRVVADQHGTPTYAPDIAAGIVTVCRTVFERPDDTDRHGVFHMTNRGSTTWAGFAEAILAASRAAGGPSAAVEPISTSEYPTPAKRPANSRMRTEKFEKAFSVEFDPWESGVRRFIKSM